MKFPTSSEAKTLKTILFMDHTARMGGGEIALLNLVTALDPARYRSVVVLATEGPLAAKLQAQGVETRVEPLDPSVRDTRKDSLGLLSAARVRQVWATLTYAFRMARLARRLKADLIHTNSLKADLYGGLAGRLAGIPVVWHVRDNIDGNYLPSPVAAAFRWLAGVVPTAVIANSENTRRTLRLPRRKTSAIVYSGVAEELVRAEQEAAGKTSFPEAPIVVLVGRIAEWKGQHIFIQAAAEVVKKFPKARFQIVGSPLFGEYDYERSLHELVQTLGVDAQVEFLGFRDDVAALLAQADVVVHASTLGEPFGQVVIEGMAAGKPVIATDGGALPEIVLPGETGLLVPMGDAPAMAAAIDFLLSDFARARNMGNAARQRVQSHFTISHTIRNLERLYGHLLGASPPPGAS